MDHLDCLRVYAEPVGDDLGEGRLVTLAVRGGTGVDGDRSGRVDANVGALPLASLGAERSDDRRRRQAACLDVGREADADLLAAVVAARRLLGAQIVVADHLQGAVHRWSVVAGVVGEGDLGLVREGVRRHEVPTANLHRTEAGGLAGEVHQPLDDEGRLGASGAAVGVDRRGVGENAGHVAVDCRDVVLPGHQRAVEVGRHGGGEGREIGAHRGRGVDAQAGDPPVGVEREPRSASSGRGRGRRSGSSRCASPST